MQYSTAVQVWNAAPIEPSVVGVAVTILGITSADGIVESCTINRAILKCYIPIEIWGAVAVGCIHIRGGIGNLSSTFYSETKLTVPYQTSFA